MRKALILAAAALAVLAACNRKTADQPRTPAPPGSGPTAVAQSSPMPQRQPGLWEQKVTTAGTTQVSQICLDKQVEARFTVWGQNAGHGNCSKTKVSSRPGGGWDFASTCDMGEGGTTATQGSVTGDFAKAYKVSARSSISGASAPQMNGTHAMTLEAAWKGPCPAGMAPGDMVLPGGMKINMLQIPHG